MQADTSFQRWVMLMHPLRVLATVLSVAAATGCASQPTWLASKIAELEQLPPATPPREIHRIDYQGRTAYLLTATCCDIPAELHEESGQLICFPYGGFAGGDGRCPGVMPVRTSAPVWRDLRATRRNDAASGAK